MVGKWVFYVSESVISVDFAVHAALVVLYSTYDTPIDMDYVFRDITPHKKIISNSDIIAVVKKIWI